MGPPKPNMGASMGPPKPTKSSPNLASMGPPRPPPKAKESKGPMLGPARPGAEVVQKKEAEVANGKPASSSSSNGKKEELKDEDEESSDDGAPKPLPQPGQSEDPDFDDIPLHENICFDKAHEKGVT